MKKILVVDDDRDIGEIIKEYLSENPDYEVVFEDCAKKAIERLNEQPFDLVVTDMLMPDMNGIELTEYIFQNFAETKVLACSGGGTSGKLVAGMALDQALQEGADNAIMKPFSEDELKTKVANLLRQD